MFEKEAEQFLKDYKMKRFLINLGKVLLLILFCPLVVIVLGTINWVELIQGVIEEE